LLYALVYGARVFWFLSRVIGSSLLSTTVHSLAWLAGTFIIMLLFGYVVGHAGWYLNERRYSRHAASPRGAGGDRL
jgi:hypothetical protein